MSNQRTRITALALAVALGLAAAACSSSPSDSSPERTTAPSAASSTRGSDAPDEPDATTTTTAPDPDTTIAGTSFDLDTCSALRADTVATTFMASLLFAGPETYGQCLADGASMDVAVVEQVQAGDFDTAVPLASTEPDSFDFTDGSGSATLHVVLERGDGGRYFVVSAEIA